MPRDPEIDQLRAQVDCRTVLERAGWLLDKAESSRRSQKFRQGSGLIIIVTHDGRGWFDPLDGTRQGRGDVLALAQRVWRLNFSEARAALRPLTGIAPTLILAPGEADKPPLTRPALLRIWRRTPRPRPGSRAWNYLHSVRAIPSASLAHPGLARLLREGRHGEAWFAHRDIAQGGELVGWEMRGPEYKGYRARAQKGLFAVGVKTSEARRIVVCEAAIDAVSLAALEGWQAGSLYCSTAGGWRAGGLAHAGLLALLGARPTPHLIAATDNGIGGELLARRLRDLAADKDAPFARLAPPAPHGDWNDQLRAQAGSATA